MCELHVDGCFYKRRLSSAFGPVSHTQTVISAKNTGIFKDGYISEEIPKYPMPWTCVAFKNGEVVTTMMSPHRRAGWLRRWPWQQTTTTTMVPTYRKVCLLRTFWTRSFQLYKQTWLCCINCTHLSFFFLFAITFLLRSVSLGSWRSVHERHDASSNCNGRPTDCQSFRLHSTINFQISNMKCLPDGQMLIQCLVHWCLSI